MTARYYDGRTGEEITPNEAMRTLSRMISPDTAPTTGYVAVRTRTGDTVHAAAKNYRDRTVCHGHIVVARVNSHPSHTLGDVVTCKTCRRIIGA